jgi:hypothetical protein
MRATSLEEQARSATAGGGSGLAFLVLNMMHRFRFEK